MNKETFLSVDLKDISQVYLGKEGCRCGCRGEYTSTSFMLNPRSDINDNLVSKRLKRAKKLVAAGIEAQYDSIFINIPVTSTRVLTFYFDEIK
jgi:hypothetical protein